MAAYKLKKHKAQHIVSSVFIEHPVYSYSFHKSKKLYFTFFGYSWLILISPTQIQP